MVPKEGCPYDPEEVADLLAIGQLSHEEAQAFLDHAKHCLRCEMEIEASTTFAEAMRAAARLLPSKEGE
jgi:hypothetical protein